MRAVVIRQPGEPEVLECREVSEPRPAADEILVRVCCVGLNRADLLQRRGLYPPPQGVCPDIPGLEFSGVVEEMGERVRRWRAGTAVLGLLAGGGYAEKVAIDEHLVMPLPPAMSFEEGAALPEAFLTAYDALFKRARLRQDEQILIHAVGSGVGSAALQLALWKGARVLGTSRSRSKLERVRRMGLEGALWSEKTGFLKGVLEKTGGRGVDVILDLVGAPYWEQNLSALSSQGRMVLVGLLGGPQVQVDLRTLMQKRLTIVGTILRSRALEEKRALIRQFSQEVLGSFASGKLHSVVDRVFPLEQAAEAHAYMEQNLNFGKIVLQVSSQEGRSPRPGQARGRERSGRSP